MKFVPKSLAVAILSSATLGAHGFDSFAQTGFTGILRTPDASVIPEGELTETVCRVRRRQVL